MLLLTATTDKFQLVTSAAITVDVHASYVDYASGVATPGKQNTAISTATTTDVVAAPAASTTRNVKTLTAQNKGASPVTVTLVFDQNGTDYNVFQATLQAGETMQYLDGVGFGIVKPTASSTFVDNASTADQTANAADTYLTGSSLQIGGRIQAGTFLRWRMAATKTAAGTATPIFNIRFGTAGTTSDTSRGTFTGVAQTAATDTGWFEFETNIRAVSATGTVHTTTCWHHKNTTTGMANAAQVQILQALSGTFDLTGSNLIVGISCNPGTSGVWTFQQVDARAFNLLN